MYLRLGNGSAAPMGPGVIAPGIAAPAVGIPTGAFPGPAKQRSEAHPNIQKALSALIKARQYLNSASHDYQGHRVAALSHVAQAIQECNICLQIDTK